MMQDQDQHQQPINTESPTPMYHPGVVSLLRFFDSGHLRDEQAGEHVSPAGVSRECRELAEWMAGALPEGPEKTAGLRKLLEAKDCFVRAIL